MRFVGIELERVKRGQLCCWTGWFFRRTMPAVDGPPPASRAANFTSILNRIAAHWLDALNGIGGGIVGLALLYVHGPSALVAYAFVAFYLLVPLLLAARDLTRPDIRFTVANALRLTLHHILLAAFDLLLVFLAMPWLLWGLLAGPAAFLAAMVATFMFLGGVAQAVSGRTLGMAPLGQGLGLAALVAAVAWGTFYFGMRHEQTAEEGLYKFVDRVLEAIVALGEKVVESQQQSDGGALRG